MDIFNTLTINDTTYKFHNNTDYSMCETYLDSDNGFVLDYKKQKGIGEYHWEIKLADLGFSLPPYNMGKYLERETPIDQLDISDLHTGKVYVLNFISGYTWYGFAFDGKEYLMQFNDGNLYLPDVMFK